jgi:hypothetical protein
MRLTFPRLSSWRFAAPTTGTAPAPEPELAPAQAILVSQIIELNPSATVGFLRTFAESSLRNYLEHLRSAQIPRGRDARWVRPDETAAVMVRERAD